MLSTRLAKRCLWIVLPLLLMASVPGCGSSDETLAEIFDESSCSAEGSANEIIKVLLVGNSLMNGVQSKIEALLTCGGYTPDFGISNPGGYKLWQHDVYAPTLNLIAQGYDLVLLQEQSCGIGCWHTFPYPDIDSLRTKIEAVGGTMGFYQTWGRFPRDPVAIENILSGYEDVGTYFSAPVMHIGMAWDFFYTSYAEYPPFPLFADTVHANTYGQSLIAYVLYAHLTGKSPVGLSSLSLSDGDASILQTIAWDIYNLYG